MFQKIRLLGAALVALLSVSGAVVVAQEQTPSTVTPAIQQRNRGDRLARQGKRRHQRREGLRGLRGLDLTDQQREQARAIMRANFESNKTQIEELKQIGQKRREGALSDADKARARELRDQLQQSRLNARTQLSGLLTAEQKSKLEERMKNRREHRRRPGRRDQINRPI